MALSKREPRRDMHLVIADLINSLGGYKAVAGRTYLSIESVNKWKQDPSGNGQVIPLVHLLTLFGMVGDDLTNLPAQNALDELLMDHILAPCHRFAYLEEKVFAVVEYLMGNKITKAVNQ